MYRQQQSRPQGRRHAARILRPMRRIVRRAIVHCIPDCEKRNLGDLGGAEGRRDYLDSDDLLLFARGDGHTLSMLIVCSRCPPSRKPQLGRPSPRWLQHSSSGNLSSHVHQSFESKRQCPSLGVTAVPSDQRPTGTRNTVRRSSGFLNAIIGEPGRSAPQILGSISRVKNIKCGSQCPS